MGTLLSAGMGCPLGLCCGLSCAEYPANCSFLAPREFCRSAEVGATGGGNFSLIDAVKGSASLYTIGQVAAMLGIQVAFLRRLDEINQVTGVGQAAGEAATRRGARRVLALQPGSAPWKRTWRTPGPDQAARGRGHLPAAAGGACQGPRASGRHPQ